MISSESIENSVEFYIEEPPINHSIETFFEKYASIPSSQLRDHLITVRDRAWNNFNYPCLAATIIDFDCCLGQDVRQLIYDGVPLEQIRGYELNPFFIEQGYQSFQDGELMKDKKKIFRCGDIFNDQFLESIEPSDYLYAGSFIHLFDTETQKDVCHRLIRLCKVAICGRQMCVSVPEEHNGALRPRGNKRMCHSPESFTHMWNEVTDGKWEVEIASLKKTGEGEHNREMLDFVVQKKTNK